MQNKLFKYQIGLAVLGLFALGSMVFLIIQAGTTKQDAETHKQASKTADDLNDYISQKQTIPSSLESAKITYNKESVSYKKISSEKYTFCVTYKTGGSTIDGTSLVTQVMYAGIDMQTATEASDYEESSLYLLSSYKKGENCQTIKPYVYEDSSDLYDNSMTTEIGSDQTSTSAAFSQLSTEVEKCNTDTSLSDEAYNTCVDKAYDTYYGSR